MRISLVTLGLCLALYINHTLYVIEHLSRVLFHSSLILEECLQTPVQGTLTAFFTFVLFSLGFDFDVKSFWSYTLYHPSDIPFQLFMDKDDKGIVRNV